MLLSKSVRAWFSAVPQIMAPAKKTQGDIEHQSAKKACMQLSGRMASEGMEECSSPELDKGYQTD
jgi:hypothetical protein